MGGSSGSADLHVEIGLCREVRRRSPESLSRIPAANILECTLSLEMWLGMFREYAGNAALQLALRVRCLAD